MKKLIFSSILFLFLLFISAGVDVQAADSYKYTGGCTEEIGLGGCFENRKCVITTGKRDDNNNIEFTVAPSTETNCNSSDIGAVTPPTGVKNFDLRAQVGNGNSGGQNIGIIAFASNLLQLFAIIAGIWAMFNFFMAGYMYITAMSDAGVTEKVKDKITMTVIGLAIIAGSYIIAGLIGLVMFGDATFIINPKLYGVSTAAPTP